MPKLTLCFFSLLLWIPVIQCGVTTEGEYTVLEGQSVVIACHYEPQYEHTVKYWCRGTTREFCTILARSDDFTSTPGSVTISDDLDQLVFTVTMKDVKKGDTGWYICGVEIGSIWSKDVITFANVRVLDGVRVDKNQVTGEEGKSVTVKCFYSEKYRDSRKKWCRSGSWSSCVPTDAGESQEDASLAISDDRTGTLTVTLKNLQLKDTGWYTCSAGKQKMSVQVLVTPRSDSVTPTSSSSLCNAFMPARLLTKDSSHNHHWESWLVCSVVVVILGIAVFMRRLWRVHKQDPAARQNRAPKTRINKYSGDVSDQQDTTVVFLNKDEKRDDALLY